ncbi:uncharacterized protein LOC107267203 isoform X1 [Cephus cinctus]|uniref:Uncharacterized protein LOC107267203 isoform X1 n=1 Tax=Cephus cinctus TaxID=211228 RepID=A0AAJ7BTM8_CEPCN|nr:uncharacterized protein LOC107267203 isoform X1 [Cephus cinctus]
MSSLTESVYTKYEDKPEESRSDFENLDITLRWNRFSLRQLGIWPDPELFGGRSLRKYKFLFPAFFMLAFTIIPQTTLLDMVWGDLDLVVDNLCVANLPMISALMKLLILRFNSKALRPVLACITEDWKNVNNPGKREVLLKYGKIAKIISLVFTFLIYMTVISYVVLQIYLNYQTKIINGTDTSRRFLFQSHFPYNTQVSPSYELTWLINLLTLDNILAILVLNVCSQYKNLQIDLKNVLENMDTYKETFIKKLSTIVRKHNHLNRLAILLRNKVLYKLVEIVLSFFCFKGVLIQLINHLTVCFSCKCLLLRFSFVFRAFKYLR